MARLVRISDRIQRIPSRIEMTSRDLIDVSVGLAAHVDFLAGPHEKINHSTCVDGLGLGEFCAMGAKLTFHHAGDDQIFVVTGYDPETKQWSLSWPD